MPLSYTEGYKKLNNQIFKVKASTVAPYKPIVLVKINDRWEDISGTNSLYMDVLYRGAPCDENGNEIKETESLLKSLIFALKFIFGLALVLAIAYFVWKNLWR